MNRTQLQFAFDGRKLVGTSRDSTLEIDIVDWTEIGVEIVHDASARSIFCLVINRNTHNVRIPDDVPVFKVLLDYFSLLEGFDWHPLVNARLKPSRAYSICWLRAPPRIQTLSAA